MTLKDKLEELCNEMVGNGKLPGAVYMNKNTLAKLAQEFNPEERIVVPDDYKGDVGLEGTAGILFFKVDESIADDEMLVKSGGMI